MIRTLMMMIVAATLTVGMIGCKKEEPKPAVPNTSELQKKAEEMKTEGAKAVEEGAKAAEEGAKKVEEAAKEAQQ